MKLRSGLTRWLQDEPQSRIRKRGVWPKREHCLKALRKHSAFAGFLCIAFAAVFLISFVNFREANAVDIGWHWDYSAGAPVVRNSTSSYSVQIASATSDFHNNTDMSVYSCPSHTNCGNVIHSQSSWGTQYPIAWALPFSGGSPCTDNKGQTIYTCDHGSNKPDWAAVRWNDSWGANSKPHFTARHEMSHVFGLAHRSCGDYSVMKPSLTCGGTYPATLTSFDENDLSIWY